MRNKAQSHHTLAVQNSKAKQIQLIHYPNRKIFKFQLETLVHAHPLSR